MHLLSAAVLGMAARQVYVLVVQSLPFHPLMQLQTPEEHVPPLAQVTAPQGSAALPLVPAAGVSGPSTGTTDEAAAACVRQWHPASSELFCVKQCLDTLHSQMRMARTARAYQHYELRPYGCHCAVMSPVCQVYDVL